MAMAMVRKRDGNIAPLTTFRALVTAVTANRVAANMLLLSAMERSPEEIKFWLKKLVGDIGEGLEAEAAGMMLDRKHRSNGILHLAAALGRGEACHTLLKEGHYNVDAEVCGGTPLIFAIQVSNSLKVVKLLLQHGATPNKSCTHGKTPLMSASEKDNCEIAELLFTYGATIDCTSGDHDSALQIATKKGNSQMLQLLLKHQSGSPDDIKISIMSLIVLAGHERQHGCVAILLEVLSDICNTEVLQLPPRTNSYPAAANISRSHSVPGGSTSSPWQSSDCGNDSSRNQKDEDRTKKSEEDVKKIKAKNSFSLLGKHPGLPAGAETAKPWVPTTGVRSPLPLPRHSPSTSHAAPSSAMVMVRKQDWNMAPPPFEALVAAVTLNKKAASMLLSSAMQQDSNGIKFWLKKLLGNIGESLEAEIARMLFDSRHQSNWILHLAASLGHEEACHVLLKEGCYDVNAKVCGRTPLIFAIEVSKSSKVVKLLLHNGASPNNSCCDGKTPLIIALKKGLYEIVDLLITFGASISIEVVQPAAKIPRSLPRTLSVAEANNTRSHSVSEANNTRSHSVAVDSTSRQSDDSKATNEEVRKMNEKEEEKIKAKITFGYGHMDKLPTLFLATFLAAVAAVKSTSLVTMLDKFTFHLICAATPVLVCSSVTLFAYGGYYKELQQIDENGFKICSWMVLSHHLCLLVLLCLVLLLLLENASKPVVLIPAAVAAITIILTWQIPNRESKCVYNYLGDLWTDWWARRRGNAGDIEAGRRGTVGDIDAGRMGDGDPEIVCTLYSTIDMV